MTALVGLAAKIFGPLRWLGLYSTGQWPLVNGVMILTKRPDLVVPFGLYLFDSRAVDQLVQDLAGAGAAAEGLEDHLSGQGALPGGAPDTTRQRICR